MSRQSAFRAAILDAERPAPPDLQDGLGRSATKRFNVYRNNVAVSLTEALEASFPATARLLGDENFRSVAGRFLRSSPPESPLMMHYGAGFPDFLVSLDALAAKGYLADVARLEQALRAAYHAADHAPIAPDALAHIAPEDLPETRFGFAPAVCLLGSEWPLLSIYRLALDPKAPKPRAEAQSVLVARTGYDPLPHLLPPGGLTFATALMAGQTLGDAAETATEASPDFDLSTCLACLLSAEAITAILP